MGQASQAQIVPHIQSDAFLDHPFKGWVKITSLPTDESTGPMSSYTYHHATGNRLIPGQAHLSSAQVVDIALPDQPLWLVGYATGLSSIWVAVLANGQVQAFELVEDTVTPLPLDYQVSVTSPPALARIKDSLCLLVPSKRSESPHSHPLFLNDSNPAFASVNLDGDLVFWQYDRFTHLLVNGLSDGRLLGDDTGRVLVLTHPTPRYAHGILGDTQEPTGIALLETRPCAQVVTIMSVSTPSVIEGLAPIWADLDGDGTPEILVTVSDATQGARFIAYAENGDVRALGSPIGRGYRWQHQLAVAPFGPEGEIELASVLTPHIGGVVEFHRLVEDRLDVVARVPGFSSHMIRSRNLDMALAADVDADGRIELLVPNQQFNALGAIRPIAAQFGWG